MESRNNLAFNKTHDYNIDYDTKTIYLAKYHLKDTDKKILNLERDMWYHITYSSVKVYIRNLLKHYENDGFRIIFEHEGRKILLRYNK